MQSSHMGTKKATKLWKRHGNWLYGIKWPRESSKPQLRFLVIKIVKPYSLFSFKVGMCTSNHLSLSNNSYQ